MSHTPAVCAAEQVARTDLLVLRAVHIVSATGKGADLVEVRDIMVLCYGMTAQDAEQAIADTQAHGLIAFRDAPSS